MKQLTVLLILVLTLTTVRAQEIAPKILATDCQGTAHDLYTELNSDKVIVIGWTMPCGTCASPLLEVHNAVLKYAISHPGRVEYWLADDYAETNCETIKDWSETNGITNATFFSTTALDMTLFGSPGMPKVVIIGCTTGNIYYNVNDFPNGTGADGAIKQALADMDKSCQNLSIGNKVSSNLKLFPNPANETLTIELEGNSKNSDLEVSVLNALGQSTGIVWNNNENATENIQLPINALQSGFYYVTIKTSEGVKTASFYKK